MNWRSEFWNRRTHEPRFDKIIWAGHSAGATQAAFLLRRFGGAGAIFLSGGADPGEANPNFYGHFRFARWVTQELDNGRHVGLYHDMESVPRMGGTVPISTIMPSVLDVNGVLDGEARAYAPGSYLQSYGTSRRLVADGQTDGLSGQLAHGITRGVNPSAGPPNRTLKKAHMYLACRAGGVPIL